MAEAVHGTRVPVSQSTTPAQTRRALLGVIPAAAIASAALAPAARGFSVPPTEAAASDAQFLVWERRLARCLADIDCTWDEDALRRLCDERFACEELIYATPSSSPIAARVRIRTLLKNEEDYVAHGFAAALENVLTALRAAW